MPKHRPEGPHSDGPRDHGSLASSGFVMGSEAGTSYTGSPTPHGEPPSLAPQDAPDDEVCIEKLDDVSC